MRAGNLNKLVTIENLSIGSDEFGQPLSNSWTTFKQMYASIIPISGNENFLGNADFAETTHKIRIRYIPGVNASMRIVWNNRIFDFISTKNISEKNKTIEILAKEVNNGN